MFGLLKKEPSWILDWKKGTLYLLKAPDGIKI